MSLAFDDLPSTSSILAKVDRKVIDAVHVFSDHHNRCSGIDNPGDSFSPPAFSTFQL